MGRQIIKHDFDHIRQGAKRSLVGESIQDIGTVLQGLDVPSFEKDQEPNKTSPDLSGFEEPTFNVEAQQLETNISKTLGMGQPLPPKRVGNISNPSAFNPSSTNPYQAFPANEAPTQAGAYAGLNYDPRVLYQPQESQQRYTPPTLASGAFNAEGRLPGSPLNRNGKDKGKEILGRNDKGEVKVEDARGNEVWVQEAPEGSEEQYEQYLKTFHDQRGPDAVPLDMHHAAASGFASPAQSLLAYKSGGRALGKKVGENKRVPTLQDLETIGLADHPLMKKAYPQLFDGSGGMTMTEESPMNRNSPFYRTTVDLTTENVSHARPGGSLGAGADIRGAAAAGFNAVVDRHNYKQKVWADKAAEADLEFGKLEVEPSGVSAWDASTEIMAREWKSELGELLTNKADYDPQEFVSKKQEILARSKQFNSAAGMLQKVVGDYNENIDNISAGTDPDVMDLLNTLNKGGGAIGVSNVNGVPTMTGETNMGKPVSIPISEIASRRGALRFAVKENIQPGLDQITQSLSKIKKDRAIAGGGLATSTVGWDQLKNSAEPQVDSLLNKASTVRSVLADRFGLDYDDVNEQFGGDIDKARAYAKEQIMGDLQQQIQPYQQAATIKRDPRAVSQSTNRGTAGERKTAADLETANKVLTKDFDYSNPESYAALGYQSVNPSSLSKENQKALEKRYPNGDYLILQGEGKPKVIPTGGANTRALVAKSLFGVDPTKLSPLNRDHQEAKKDGPFKRLMNWATSPFKRDPKNKTPEGADPVTPTLGFEGYEEDPDRIVHLGDDVEAAHREAGGHVTESGGLVQGAGGGLLELVGAGALGTAGAKAGIKAGGKYATSKYGYKALLNSKYGGSVKDDIDILKGLGGAIGGIGGAGAGASIAGRLGELGGGKKKATKKKSFKSTTGKASSFAKQDAKRQRDNQIKLANAQNREWRKQGYSKEAIDKALRRDYPELYK